MPTEKDAILRKSVDVLIDKANVTSALAKDQRVIADHEHVTANEHNQVAHKLELVSQELAAGAAALKKRMDALPK